MALKENYKDDILDVSVNTKRKYRMTENADGTISLDDETVYTQEGDSFGASDLNAMTHAINNTSSDAEHTSYDNTESGLISDNVQGAIDEINDNLEQTPITKGGVVLSTIDDKLNYLVEGAPNPYKEIVVSTSTYNGTWGRNYTEIEIDTNSIYSQFSGGSFTRNTEYLSITMSTSGANATYSIKARKPCYVTYKRTTSNNSTELEVSARNYAVGEYIRNETVSDSIDLFTLLVEEPRT